MLPILSLAIALASSTLDPPDRWPSFLGVGHRAVDPATVPTSWSPETNLAWQVEVPGYGQSSPVVWDGTVYLTSVEGPNKETYHLSALRLSDGALQWKYSFANSAPLESSVYVSRAAPTPCADADGVYAFFESGDLVALDHAGEERWKRNLAADYGAFQNRFGIGASPAQDEKHLFVLADHEGPSFLAALDKASGETVWKADRTSRVSWSSPVLLDFEGVAQVVMSSAGSADGYDAATGKLLWTLDGLGGNTANTPVPFGPGRFLCGASPGQRGEYASTSPKTNIAVEVKRDAEGGWSPEVLWTAERATSSFGSPIVHAGHAYYVNSSGIVTCFDAATGERRYAERLPETIWATPLGIGDRVYFFGKDGLTTVLAAGPEHRELAQNSLWEEAPAPEDEGEVDEETARRREAEARFGGPIQYGYACAAGNLLIRTGKKLYCVRETAK